MFFVYFTQDQRLSVFIGDVPDHYGCASVGVDAFQVDGELFHVLHWLELPLGLLRFQKLVVVVVLVNADRESAEILLQVGVARVVAYLHKFLLLRLLRKILFHDFGLGLGSLLKIEQRSVRIGFAKTAGVAVEGATEIRSLKLWFCIFGLLSLHNVALLFNGCIKLRNMPERFFYFLFFIFPLIR